jgi:hypothetical protein
MTWFSLLKVALTDTECDICGANDWHDYSHKKNEPNWECKDCGNRLNNQRRKKSSPRGNQSKKQKNREKREARRNKRNFLKSQMSGKTEWWGELPEKIYEFGNVGKARYKAKILNAELQANEPLWEVYNTPRMPIMLKRVFI